MKFISHKCHTHSSRTTDNYVSINIPIIEFQQCGALLSLNYSLKTLR